MAFSKEWLNLNDGNGAPIALDFLRFQALGADRVRDKNLQRTCARKSRSADRGELKMANAPMIANQIRST